MQVDEAFVIFFSFLVNVGVFVVLFESHTMHSIISAVAFHLCELLGLLLNSTERSYIFSKVPFLEKKACSV